MVQPFAAEVPWMVAAGNHEIFDLFLAYEYRFAMPGNYTLQQRIELLFQPETAGHSKEIYSILSITVSFTLSH
jgi:hypothetical protein